MIKFLPKINEDELLSSYFARMYSISPYTSSIAFSNQVFINGSEYMDYLFYNGYKDDIKELLDESFGIQNLIENHTLVKLYSLFQDDNIKRETITKACRFDKYITHQLNIPAPLKEKRRLRYCPLCMKEQKYFYFEVLPQIRELTYCPKHCCKYKNTNILIDKKHDSSFNEIIDTKIEIDNYYCIAADDINVRFSKYVYSVLKQPITFENASIGKFIKSKLEGTKYLSMHGVRCKLDILYGDIKSFYVGLDNYGLTKNRVALIIRDKEFNVIDTLLICYFLDISPKELTHRVLPMKTQRELFERKVLMMYREGKSMCAISKITCCDKETIRQIIINCS